MVFYMKPIIFIGGAGRSGTTLLRVILDSHPAIICGPEIKTTPRILQSFREACNLVKIKEQEKPNQEELAGVYGDFIKKLFRVYYHNSPLRYAEKTPHNCFYWSEIKRILPDAKCINIIRDGRDVVCSLLEQDWDVTYCKDIHFAIGYWNKCVEFGTREDVYQVKYEDIINNPKETLKKIFEYIEEPWDENVLKFYKKKHNLAKESSRFQVTKPIYKSAMHRWKRDMSEANQLIFKKMAGDTLIKLGYEKDNDW